MLTFNELIYIWLDGIFAFFHRLIIRIIMMGSIWLEFTKHQATIKIGVVLDQGPFSTGCCIGAHNGPTCPFTLISFLPVNILSM
jgi:hypothetical protein